MFPLLKKIFLVLLLSTTCQILIAQQTDKLVTLTVSGSGKTKEAATQSALRSAIEQAFGAFVSSKTELLNDSLISDQIVSISNGNIQKYSIISEIKLPNEEYGITINAVVSISRLTTFCESKGIGVEVQGGLFAANIKQQMLNEESEINACKNLIEILTKIAFKCFDFTINANDPVSMQGDNNIWSINSMTTVNPNENLNSLIKYLYESLSAITMTEAEKLNYKNLNKNTFEIKFLSCNDLKERSFCFRNLKSLAIVCSLMNQLVAASLSYRISYEGINSHFDGFWMYNNTRMDRVSIAGGELPFRRFNYRAGGIIDIINLSQGFVHQQFHPEQYIGYLQSYNPNEHKWIFGLSSYYSQRPYLQITNSKEIKLSELEKIKSINVSPVDFSTTDYPATVTEGWFRCQFYVGPNRFGINDSLINGVNVGMPKIVKVNSKNCKNGLNLNNYRNYNDLSNLKIDSHYLNEGNLKIFGCETSGEYRRPLATLELPEYLYNQFIEDYKGLLEN